MNTVNVKITTPDLSSCAHKFFLIRETRLSLGRRSTCGLINLHSKEWHSYCAKAGEEAIQFISLATFTRCTVNQEVACT